MLAFEASIWGPFPLGYVGEIVLLVAFVLGVISLEPVWHGSGRGHSADPE